MTMYVRAVAPITLTISSPDNTDDVLLDGNHPIAVLPLWAAQRDEFQTLWDDGAVEVATDPNFNDIITEIPASETGAVDPTQFAQLDEGGRIPGGIIPNILYLEQINDADGHTVLRLLDGTIAPAPASNHVVISNATANHTPYIGVSGDDADINLQLTAVGDGRVVLGDNSRVLSTTIPLNRRFGDYTLAAIDAGALVTVDSNDPQTVTVPASATVNWPEGTFIDVARFGVGTVTLAGAAGVNLFATPGLKIAARFAQARLTKIGPDSWLVTGSLAA